MPGENEDLRERLLAVFRVEAEEHLQAVTANLLALERGLPAEHAPELVEATFREMHTLKGAARSVNMRDVEELCRACESVLGRITRDRLPLTAAIVEGLFDAVALIDHLLAGRTDPTAVRELAQRLERNGTEPEKLLDGLRPRVETPAEPAAAAPVQTETIRLPTAKLDALFLHAEDLLLPKLAAEERAAEAKALVEALARCRDRLARRGARGQDGGLPAILEPELRAAETQARELQTRLVRDQRRIASAVDSLQDELRRVRMTPATAALDLFPRMVRSLAEEHGKEVAWVARGGDLEVDRKILDAMKDPLIHLVRNAVAHGIEPPDAREQAGKARRGRVSVTFSAREGGRIEIAVEDDGGGADLDRVREAAVRARLLTAEEAEGLSDDQALDLVYRSGLSTSPIITDLSGHGLGLAIVKEQVERLDGQIRFESRPGAGVTVLAVLPATIATFRGLLVRAGGQRFLLPLDAVERVLRVGPDEVALIEGREAVPWNGGVLSVARASDLLGLSENESGAENGSKRPCVIVRAGAERIGFLVEGVLGDRELLVKELGPPLVRVRNVAGAGLLGTGEVVLILRPADLVRGAHEIPRQAAAVAPAEESRQPAILVVDDSITTRAMEKNLLEAAGYRVQIAVDGVEAWAALKSEEFDLVVSDLDMPRMDGFELTERIRADRDLAELPVVLVTALESREDKERGIEVGANAYIVKSSFDQSNLLEIIHRLTVRPTAGVS